MYRCFGDKMERVLRAIGRLDDDGLGGRIDLFDRPVHGSDNILRGAHSRDQDQCEE